MAKDVSWWFDFGKARFCFIRTCNLFWHLICCDIPTAVFCSESLRNFVKWNFYLNYFWLFLFNFPHMYKTFSWLLWSVIFSSSSLQFCAPGHQTLSLSLCLSFELFRAVHACQDITSLKKGSFLSSTDRDLP